MARYGWWRAAPCKHACSALSPVPHAQDTLWTLAKWVVAFPVVVYTITKWEYAKSDRLFGREERKFM